MPESEAGQRRGDRLGRALEQVAAVRVAGHHARAGVDLEGLRAGAGALPVEDAAPYPGPGRDLG